MERIWSESKQKELKGAINSFPYERREVEQALAEFRDAGGKIFVYEDKARFRRCCCVGEDGKRKVCVPPKVGYMCERKAIMIRTRFVLESTMVVRRRIQNETARIEQATEAAKKVAKEYLDSEEGKEAVRLLAEQRLQPQGPMEELSLDTIHDISSTIRSKSERQQGSENNSLRKKLTSR